MMAKGHYKSTKRLLLGLLFLPLLYAAALRCKVYPLNLWRFQLGHMSISSIRNNNETAGTERNLQHARFLLRRLVRGTARRELIRQGVACISDAESDFCVTTDAVRIATAAASAAEPATVFLAAGQRLPLDRRSLELRPYARKTDALAMARTSPVRLLAGASVLPACDVVHPGPAIFFSTGGFAGNFFHDVNDVIIPLFLTAGPLRTRACLVVGDFESWWARKYGLFLDRLSPSGTIVASSNSTPTDGRVHCFPAAVVGLKYHGNLACDPDEAPGGVSGLDFRTFLRGALSLGAAAKGEGQRAPVLVLLSRRRSRVLLNEEAVAGAATEAGFEVVRATPERMADVAEFAAAVGGCDVLMGVHGAGLTNMVFQREGAVMVQVVPWGLDWAAAEYYGRPAAAMGLRYVEYHVAVEESTLSTEYARDHPVLADPWAINRQGYSVSRPIYTDGQNVTLDLDRFRPTLLRVQQLLLHGMPRAQRQR